MASQANIKGLAAIARARNPAKTTPLYNAVKNLDLSVLRKTVLTGQS